MSFSNSKLDSFVQEVLQGNGLNKSASSSVYTAPVENNQSVVDAVNKAYSHLTQEEVSMADTLGFMEAANTVKQANYINEQIGGERNMSFYNQSQNPYLAYKSAGVAGGADIFGASGKAGELYHSMTGTADAGAVFGKAPGVLSGIRLPSISGGASAVGGALGGKKVGKAVANMLYKEKIMEAAGAKNGKKVGELAKSHHNTIEGVNSALGYGVGAAGIAGLAGAGLLGHKMIRQRQALQRAKLEQSIGAKVLGHLGRHAGKYALGAGILGAGALAYNSKAASDEAYLMDHAAQVGEEFIQKLASQAYENALVNELQLFREAAIDDVNAQQAYYGNGYGY